MKKILPLSIFLFILTSPIFSQSDSATYVAGALPTQFEFTTVLTDDSYGCTDTLIVNIPAGNYVTSVDVYYSVEALGAGEVSQQSSFLECISTGNLEGAVSIGDPNWDSIGIYSYARTGLNIANGTSATGELQFFLHAFRSNGFFPGCANTQQTVVDSTWKIVVHHIPAPTCFPPSNISSSARTMSSITIDWTTGGASDWNIEYGVQGFTQGSGTIVNASSVTSTIGSLNPGVCYDFYVRDSCGPGDVSIWEGPFTECTLCNPSIAPWTENFDGASWISGTGVDNISNDIDFCWSRPSDANPNFGTRTGTTTTGTSGPASDFSGAGNYLYTEASNGATGAGEITSPSIVIPNTMTTPMLEYQYHMFGFNITSLEVQIDNGSGFVSIGTITGAQQTGNNDPWQEDTIHLTAYLGDTVILRFIGTNGGFAGDIAIDEVGIVEAPTCTDAFDLGANEVGLNYASVFWTTGGATAWEVEYGAIGFAIGSGTRMAALNDTTIINGLSPGSCYEFYTRDSCGPGSVGNWIGPFSFCTQCNPTTAPWTETFDGGSWVSGAGATNAGNDVDACWIRLDPSNPNFGTRTGATTTGNSGPASDFSGAGNYLFTEASGGAVGPGEIVSPLVIIPNSMTTPMLRYYYHMFGTDITSLDVQVDNGSGFVSIGTITGAQQTGNNDPWLEDTIHLTQYLGDTIAVKFIGTNTGFSGDIAIDEVSIIEAPTCTDPSNLGVNAVGLNYGSVFWTTGGATAWNIEYGIVGYPQGSGTIVQALNDTTIINGLNPGTCYDAYVRDSCGPGSVGNWIGPITFCTLCNPTIAPWSENFDGATWVSGIGAGNGDNEVDVCWFRLDPSNPNFGTRIGTTGSFGTGPNGDASGAGNYLYTEASGSNGTGEIISPYIIIPNTMIAPQLEFSYHMAGANVVSLDIQIDNGSGFGTNAKSILGAQQAATADPWLTDTLDLTAYIGDTIRLKILGTNNGFQADISIDELSIDEAPTCNDPSDLGLDAAFTNSATIFWTGGGASDWEIEYGSQGFSVGSGTRIASSTDTLDISSLTASTCYDFYVRDSCGPGDVSAWVGPFTFCTTCAPVTTPYTEDFDGTVWTTGANNTDLGTIDACWVRTPETIFAWKTGPAPTPSGLTGPSADHTTGSGGFIYSERLNALNGDTIEAFAQTPPIAISGLTNPALTFWYHMYGNSVVGLEVEVNNGSGWNTIYTRVGQQQTSNIDPWKEAVINLSAYNGDTILLRFMSTNNNGGTNNDVAIDDVEIDEAPACPKPQDLQIVGTTNTSATLSWITGGATNWNIEYGAPGFAQGSGTIVAVTSNPATITGLSANTNYEFYVQDSCSATEVSDWIGPVGAETDCNPVSAPLIEDFDGAAWVVGINQPGTLGSCWRTNPDSLFAFTPGQNATPSNNTGPDFDHTSGNGKYVYSETYYNFAGFNPNQTVLSSPLVDLTPLIIPELKFYYHMYGSDITSLDVRVFDGSTSASVAIISGQQQSGNTDPWLEAIIDLSAYAGDTIKIEFVALKQVGFSIESDISIDDFSIDEKPACSKPTNLSASNATTTSVDLSWITGGATLWEIEYGPAGFTQGQGTIIPATTNPFTVPGLNPSTTYEFYVRDSCGTGNVSEWVGPVLLNTLCSTVSAPYSENFDGPNFDPGANGFGVAGTIDACWNRLQTATYFWKAGPSTPQTNGTGPLADHTTGSGGYLFTESGGFAQPPQTAEVETPEIDLSPLTTPELTFWYHMFGPNVGTLDVEVSNDAGATWTNVFSVSGAQQGSQAAAWLEAIVDISAFANDSIVVKFTASKSTFGNQSDAAIDDVEIDEAPACPKSTALTVTSVTSTTASLSWTAGGGAGWRVEYGPVGFTPGMGSGTTVSAPTNPFTITGLTPNTGYDFYVQDSCDATNSSEWSDPYGDTTNCSIFTAPYMENFDGSTFLVGGSINNPGEIDGCWERTFANTYFWATEQNGTVSANTGPSADHTTGAGKFMFSDGFGQAQQTELISPEIDLSALTAPELRFWYHMYGANIDRMEVDVFNGNTWTTELTITGQQQTANADPWIESVVSLASYVGDTIQVRYVAFRQGNQTANDMSIDDVWIGDSTACARPDSAILIASTTNSITIQWNNYSGIGGTIRYRPAGSSSPFIYQAATSGNATLSGLSPSTTYEVFINDSCGTGNISLWTSGYLFSTLCGAVTAPWSEDFDGAGWFPGAGNDNTGDQISACWFRSTNTGIRWGTGTGGTNSGQTGPSGDVGGGGQYIYTEATIATGRSTIESPTIFLPLNLSQPVLQYYYHMYGVGIDSMYVRIDNGSGFTTHKIYLGQQQNANAAAWLSDTIDLSIYSGDSIQIQFVGVNTTFRGDIAVDQLTIDGQITTCNEPTAISFSSIGNTSAVISWTSNSGSSELEIVPSGQAQGTGTLYAPVTSPFTVTNLLPLTAYDVYVRDVCGTQFSSWEDSNFVTTACPAVNAFFTSNINLLNVSFDASATNGADTLIWTFGDGNSSTGINTNASNIYSTPGTYTVTLIGYNACGNSDTTTQTITVCDSLVADFSFTQLGDTLDYDATGSYGALTYRWDYGDGTDSLAAPIGQYIYSSSGTFSVTLTVYNECGDSSSITKVIQSCGPPEAVWTFNVISTTSSGMLVQFDGSTSLNATTYNWDFGDGNSNNVSAIPQHTYIIPSLQYTVTLTVTNLCGDVHTFSSRMDQIGLIENNLEDRQLSIYPNPAEDILNVELVGGERLEDADIIIFDVTGKKVIETNLSLSQGESSSIIIKELPPGYYNLEIQTPKNRQNYPVIIK